jgi:hypothetical protein
MIHWNYKEILGTIHYISLGIWVCCFIILIVYHSVLYITDPMHRRDNKTEPIITITTGETNTIWPWTQISTRKFEADLKTNIIKISVVAIGEDRWVGMIDLRFLPGEFKKPEQAIKNTETILCQIIYNEYSTIQSNLLTLSEQIKIYQPKR